MIDESKPNLLDLLADWDENRRGQGTILPESFASAYPMLSSEFLRKAKRLVALDMHFEVAGFSTLVEYPKIPGYEISGVIGQGGMGVVFRGHDQMLNRPVAVKMPVGQQFDADHRRRFEREMIILAKLRHPNIVSIYHAGIMQDAPYLVMEYVEGGSLAEQHKHFSGNTDRAVEIVRLIARAIGHAHSAGVVHRDIKPSNILLDKSQQPLVSDFGIAAILTNSAPQQLNHEQVDVRMTQTGFLMGTPAYAAPEQFEPDQFGIVGAATDVWAIGVILYELLHGKRPFLGTTWNELREQVCRGELPLKLHSNRYLAQILARCLAKQPSERFKTANELADRLNQILTRGRRRIRVALILSTILFTVLFLFYFLHGSSEINSRKKDIQILDDVSMRKDEEPVLQNEDIDPTVRLMLGETVELIRPRREILSNLVLGEQSGDILDSANGLLRIRSTSGDGCIVELKRFLPAWGSYRIDAEISHGTSDTPGWVGVYAGGCHASEPTGDLHFMNIARYSDNDKIEEVSAKSPFWDVPTVQSAKRTHLVAQTYVTSKNVPFVTTKSYISELPKGEIVPAPPTEWRRLSLVVNQDKILAKQGYANVGKFDIAMNEYFLRNDLLHFPNLLRIFDPKAVHYGGCGIYLKNATVSVRSFRIISLEE